MRAAVRVGCAALAALLAGCTGAGRSAEIDDRAAPRPNVLVFVTDDQRATGTFGVMPATRALFARAGTRFTRAFATTPICCPSRASIMTGRYAHNHGVRQNPMGDELDLRTTIQYHLKRAGYRTGIFGKYLQGLELTDDPPYFDRWRTFNLSKFSYEDAEWNVQGTVTEVDEHPTSYVRSSTLAFLEETEEEDGRPWFLYVSPSAPHPPAIPEDTYARTPVPSWRPNPAIRERDRSDKPGHVRGETSTRRVNEQIRRRQLRTLMSVDDLVADVMGALEDHGESRRTLAFFLSDNGYMWGEHGLRTKFHPYTRSVAIPLLMRWPGRIASGTRDRRLAATIDIAPTILDAVGLRGPLDGMDGRSLLRRSTRGALLFEAWRTSVPRWVSLRTRRYQYTEYYGRAGGLRFKELYWIGDDPWQLRNVLRDGVPGNAPPARWLQRVHDRLVRARQCSRASCP